MRRLYRWFCSLFKPRHTVESVAKDILEGLENRTVYFQRPNGTYYRLVVCRGLIVSLDEVIPP